MGKRVVIALVLTCRVRLIHLQRRFGGEDAHIIDDKVITVIVSRHVIDAHTEVCIFLVHLYREINLIPLVGLSKISCHIRSNIFPCGAIQRTLYSEREVRTGLTCFVTGVSDESGEVHLLTLTERGVEFKCCHLSGGGHTVAEDHISVFGTSVLLHLMPIGTERGDTVDEVILTHVREVRQAALIMRTVIRQRSRPRVRARQRCGTSAPRPQDP